MMCIKNWENRQIQSCVGLNICACLQPFLFLAKMTCGLETLFSQSREEAVYLSTLHFQRLQQLCGACQVNKTKASINSVGVYMSAGLKNKVSRFIALKITAWLLHVLLARSNFSQTLLFLLLPFLFKSQSVMEVPVGTLRIDAFVMHGV